MEAIMLITAFHGIKDSKKLNLLFNNEKETKVINLDDSRIVYKDEKLDIVIIEIKPSDKINYTYLEIDEEYSTNQSVNNYNNKLVFILGYPYGNDCTLSFGKMNVAETNNKKCIFHKCSSSTGSSGSPIILLENSKCIGIHLLGGTLKNGGNFLNSSVIDFINEYKNKYSSKTNENKLKDKQTYNNTDNQYNNNLYDNNIKGKYNQNINKDNNVNNQYNENQNNKNYQNNENINNNMNNPNINNQYQQNRVNNNKMISQLAVNNEIKASSSRFFLEHNQNIINENMNKQNNNNINDKDMINNNDLNTHNIINNMNYQNNYNMNCQNNKNKNYQNNNNYNNMSNQNNNGIYYQNNNNMNNLNNNNSMNNINSIIYKKNKKN